MPTSGLRDLVRDGAARLRSGGLARVRAARRRARAAPRPEAADLRAAAARPAPRSAALAPPARCAGSRGADDRRLAESQRRPADGSRSAAALARAARRSRLEVRGVVGQQPTAVAGSRERLASRADRARSGSAARGARATAHDGLELAQVARPRILLERERRVVGEAARALAARRAPGVRRSRRERGDGAGRSRSGGIASEMPASARREVGVEPVGVVAARRSRSSARRGARAAGRPAAVLDPARAAARCAPAASAVDVLAARRVSGARLRRARDLERGSASAASASVLRAHGIATNGCRSRSAAERVQVAREQRRGRCRARRARAPARPPGAGSSARSSSGSVEVAEPAREARRERVAPRARGERPRRPAGASAAREAARAARAASRSGTRRPRQRVEEARDLGDVARSREQDPGGAASARRRSGARTRARPRSRRRARAARRAAAAPRRSADRPGRRRSESSGAAGQAHERVAPARVAMHDPESAMATCASRLRRGAPSPAQPCATACQGLRRSRRVHSTMRRRVGKRACQARRATGSRARNSRGRSRASAARSAAAGSPALGEAARTRCGRCAARADHLCQSPTLDPVRVALSSPTRPRGERVARRRRRTRGPAAQLVRAALRRRDRRRAHLLLAARDRRRRDHRAPAPQHRPAHLRGRPPHGVPARDLRVRALGHLAPARVVASCTRFPFYNTEQQSQRYVRLDEVRAHVPPRARAARRARVYEARGRARLGGLSRADARASTPVTRGDPRAISGTSTAASARPSARTSRARPRRRRSRPRAT